MKSILNHLFLLLAMMLFIVEFSVALTGTKGEEQVKRLWQRVQESHQLCY